MKSDLFNRVAISLIVVLLAINIIDRTRTAGVHADAGYHFTTIAGNWADDPHEFPKQFEALKVDQLGGFSCIFNPGAAPRADRSQTVCYLVYK